MPATSMIEEICSSLFDGGSTQLHRPPHNNHACSVFVCVRSAHTNKNGTSRTHNKRDPEYTLRQPSMFFSASTLLTNSPG